MLLIPNGFFHHGMQDDGIEFGDIVGGDDARLESFRLVRLRTVYLICVHWFLRRWDLGGFTSESMIVGHVHEVGREGGVVVLVVAGWVGWAEADLGEDEVFNGGVGGRSPTEGVQSDTSRGNLSRRGGGCY